MIDNFKPPIKSRTTQELLNIVGSPKKWNRDALYLAKYELSNRNVDTSEIENAIKLANEKEEEEILRKVNKSYQISDFILKPKGTLFELLFTWELKKDGYILKAKQQKTFRITLIIIILFVYLIKFIQEN
ncbi:hypothetical protein [Flavobacterium hibernum]|uniref:Uncharacterized protein n=1 Tax=Flavobacterium hibernum TaxID=37752 RepID=A0A0D0EMC2_9FLAO|nr:hypothetical protein [Flavobacterium hibernum]KIO53620.1 hypothetical protein IW18_04535 [Flavobacterium hibernum]OXA90776.1 hypothetical protein B0A73_03300 [Flavobacterium hibernum]STO15064.1 Uncharacterised protein [Flavobacterium hibernum]